MFVIIKTLHYIRMGSTSMMSTALILKMRNLVGLEEIKKRMHGDLELKMDWIGSNTFDDIYAYYQYSDDADSPLSSETDDDGDHGRKKKVKRTMRYPRYKASSSKEEVKL